MRSALFKDGGPAVGDVHVNAPMGGERRRRKLRVPLPTDGVKFVAGQRTITDIEDEAHADLRDSPGAVSKRDLRPHVEGTAKSPFRYDPNALGDLRPDQVPRFFGALTDSDRLPTKEVSLNSLHAMQDRVDPKKVQAIRQAGAGAKLATVVRANGRHYIADGHHRLTADWLNGKDKADVHFKDLDRVDQALKSANSVKTYFKVSGVDQGLGLVFGWGIVCKEGGQDYYDVQGNHIPEGAMVEAVTDFMKSGRMAGEQHSRMKAGTIVHSFPLTSDIATAMGIGTNKTGWMVAMAPDPALLAKFKSGEMTGFSIGGEHIEIDGKPIEEADQ